MRKLLLLLAATLFVLLLPLSVPSSAQGDDEEPETTEQAEENDPNLIDRAKECDNIVPALQAACLLKAGLTEGAQETVDVATGAALSAWALFVEQFVGSALGFLVEVTSFWVETESVIENESLVRAFQDQFAWLAGFMVIGGIIWQGIRLIYQRKPDGLGVMLSACFKFVVISAGGHIVIQEFSEASDTWAGSIVQANATELEAAISNPDSPLNNLIDAQPGLAFMLAIFLILGGIMQTVLFVLRDLSLLVMTGFLVFAASGQFFEFSRSWLGRVIGPILAILLYKPMAALIMKIALDLLNTGETFGVVAGVAMVFLSAFSIKPFMKIFAVFTPEGMTPFGSGGGLNLGGAAMGMGVVGMAAQASVSDSGGGGSSSSPSSPAPSPQLASQASTPTGAGPSSAPQISAPASTNAAASSSTTQVAGSSGVEAASTGSPHAMAAMAAVKAAEEGPKKIQAAGTEMGDRMSGGT